MLAGQPRTEQSASSGCARGPHREAAMTSSVRFNICLLLSVFFLLFHAAAAGQDPKPKPENTISAHLGEPVPAQKFANPPKFWISDVIDRSGNPQPVLVKNPKSGESLEVKAAGTSIAKTAMLKKNIQKNVQDDVEESLRDAVRNFLHGQQLKDAVGVLRKSMNAAPVTTPNP